MPNNDYIKRSDALKAILGLSIYDTLEELDGARTIGENTWADGLYDAYKVIDDEVDEVVVDPKQRWIPVTERLPVGGDDSGAVCENVCLMLDDGTVSCGWMNGITQKVYFLNAKDDFIIKAPITRVTHWMPLPEKPKGEEDGKK